MSPEGALIELLGRVGAQGGAPVLVGDDELNGWPSEAVAAMKKKGLLTKARPAASAVCLGCERECVMPVHILTSPGREPQAFIVCDRRSDINRVPMPVDGLGQWQASGDSIADVLADLLGLHRARASNCDAARWEVGLLKGKKHASHVVLTVEGALTLNLAGHSVEITEALSLEGDGLKVDKRKLIRLVDQPVAGAGDIESAEQRRARIKNRVNELKAQGVKAFLKKVAEEEGVSVSRIKQLTQDDHPTPKSKPPHW